MNEIEALDKIQKNFKDIKLSEMIDFLNVEMPTWMNIQCDYLLRGMIHHLDFEIRVREQYNFFMGTNGAR